jgi:hypothetical protein
MDIGRTRGNRQGRWTQSRVAHAEEAELQTQGRLANVEAYAPCPKPAYAPKAKFAGKCFIAVFIYVGTGEFSKKMCAGSFHLFLFKYTLLHKHLYTKVVYFVKMEVPITKKEPETKY